MRVENFINFFIVVGFFVGLVFSLLKVNTPEQIVVYTIVITISFYIIALVSSSFFIKFFNFKDSALQKEAYDDILDYYVAEIEKREKVSEKLFEFFELFHKEEEIQKMKDKADIASKIREFQK